jgi:uncharacterized membrane protein
MDTVGKMLLACGLLLVVAGVVVLLASRYGLHRLPGDIVIRRPHFTLYIPVGLMIVLSIVLTIVLNLLSRRR